MLKPYVDNMFKLVELIDTKSVKQCDDSVIKAAVSLMGDIADVLQLTRHNENVKKVLKKAKNSKNKDLKEAHKWADDRIKSTTLIG